MRESDGGTKDGARKRAGSSVLAPRLSLVTTGLLLAACGSATSKSAPTSSEAATTSAPSSVSTAPSTTAPAAAAPAQSKYLAGNAHPQYPAGTPGHMVVVYQAPIRTDATGTTVVPLVFRNNTEAAVAHVDIAASATDPAGKIVASGSSQGTWPSMIEPGQWAYSFIYYGPGTAVAPTDRLAFTFRTSPASTDPFNTAPIQVTQANLSGSTIAGGVQNTTGHTVQGPISVTAFCLNSSGDPTAEVGGFTTSTSAGNLAAGGTDSYQLTLYDQPCTTFLVGASGYYT